MLLARQVECHQSGPLIFQLSDNARKQISYLLKSVLRMKHVQHRHSNLVIHCGHRKRKHSKAEVKRHSEGAQGNHPTFGSRRQGPLSPSSREKHQRLPNEIETILNNAQPRRHSGTFFNFFTSFKKTYLIIFHVSLNIRGASAGATLCGTSVEASLNLSKAGTN